MKSRAPSGITLALRQMFSGFRAYVWLFIGLFSLYLIVSPYVILGGSSSEAVSATSAYDGDTHVKSAIAIVMVVLFAITLLLFGKNRLTSGTIGGLLITGGFVLRFGYMLYTPFYIHGHDILTYDGYGHLAYIFKLFIDHTLPDNNWGQFYHPPLAHMADAAVAWIYALLTSCFDLDTVFEATRLVPCFASCALLLLSSRLLTALDFKGRGKNIALAVITFHPTFILLSASINNDMLMVLFFMSAFLYSIRWYKDPSYKNILLLALSIGCAMSTKFSGALVAFFTAGIFLLVLVRRIMDGRAWPLMGQFAAFSALCFPLGLWYHIRNLKLFGQVLGYVAEIPKTSTLYTGDEPFIQRFFSFSLPHMLQTVYCNPFTDYRLLEYTVLCALFGEFTFSPIHDIFAKILIISSVLLIVLSLGAMVWFLCVDRTKNRLAVISFSAVWALLFFSFVFFNIKYPFGCTMDFRYIVPTVITGAGFLGLLSDKLRGSIVKNGLFIGFFTVLAVFSTASVCFYII